MWDMKACGHRRPRHLSDAPGQGARLEAQCNVLLHPHEVRDQGTTGEVATGERCCTFAGARAATSSDRFQLKVWGADFRCLESAIWRWWPRRAPVGTSSRAGSRRSVLLKKRREIGTTLPRNVVSRPGI